MGPIDLLTLRLGGRLFRFASVAGSYGDVWYEGGLGQVALTDAGDRLAEVDVSVLAGVDWAQLAAEGMALEVGEATLMRYWPLIDEVELLMRGVVSEPEYGGADEPLELTIRHEDGDAIPMIPPGATVSAETWPVNYLVTGQPYSFSFDERIEGQLPPLVFGQPGASVVPGLAMAATRGATPGLIVQFAWAAATPGQIGDLSPWNYMLLSYGHVAASSVRVWLQGGSRQYQLDLSPFAAVDALGHPVTLAFFDGAHAADIGQGRLEAWVGWGLSEGGLVEGDRPIRGAGDVISWVLRHRTRKAVDWGRLATVIDELNAYKVDAYVNAAIDGWQWLLDTLFPTLPVAVLESEDGLYLRLQRWGASRTDAIAHLEAGYAEGGAGLTVSRASRILSLRQQLSNEISVEYQWSWGQVFAGRVWVTAAPGELGSGEPETRAYFDEACAASRAAVGYRPHPEPIEVPWTHDRETAIRIARDMAARYAMPIRTVVMEGGWDLARIEPWDVVTVTDPSVSLYRRPALVMERSLSSSGVSLTLALLRDRAGLPVEAPPYSPSPVPPVPWPDPELEVRLEHGDIETGGVGSAGTVETGGV